MTTIDRDKLRAALRRLGDEYVYYMLDDALELLPDATLAKLAGRYINVRDLRPDPASKRGLLADVRRFDTRSRAGEFYESFNVNSKNCMEKSPGTRAFIAESLRLFDRCVEHASKGDPIEAAEAFGILIDLVRYIDACNDDIVFFADEGGAWQVPVNWSKVFPVWFKCLSGVAEPEEYADRVIVAVDALESHARERHFEAARRFATAEQRVALDEAVGYARRR